MMGRSNSNKNTCILRSLYFYATLNLVCPSRAVEIHPSAINRDVDYYLFAASSEGACVGITSSVYIWVNSSQGNHSFKLAAASAAFQSKVEMKLRPLFASVPEWVSTECYFVLRKLFCGSYFLYPQRNQLGDVVTAMGYNTVDILSYWQSDYNISEQVGRSILNDTFYAPSYPHRSVCEEYKTQCSTFASRMYETKGISTFMVDCDAMASSTSTSILYSGIRFDIDMPSTSMFPRESQVVERFPIMRSSRGNITWLNISTSPNYMLNASLSADGVAMFETKCPYGFVVPDDKEHPRNHWVEGTGCAEACRLVIITVQPKLPVLHIYWLRWPVGSIGCMVYHRLLWLVVEVMAYAPSTLVTSSSISFVLYIFISFFLYIK